MHVFVSARFLCSRFYSFDCVLCSLHIVCVCCVITCCTNNRQHTYVTNNVKVILDLDIVTNGLWDFVLWSTTAQLETESVCFYETYWTLFSGLFQILWNGSY